MNHPLADELFLVGHDEYTGKPTGNAGVLARTLAGAVLGELLLDGRLTIVEGRVAVQAARAYGEKTTDAVMGEVCRQGDRLPVRHWVGYLRGDVREVVARRLVATGLVRREQPRGLARRGHTRYPAGPGRRPARDAGRVGRGRRAGPRSGSDQGEPAVGPARPRVRRGRSGKRPGTGRGQLTPGDQGVPQVALTT
jgi:hypothetical protein